MRVFLVLLVLCLASFSASLAAPVLQVDDPVWNVGRLTAGIEQTRTFTVRNAGSEPLVIKEVEQCCGFVGKLDKTTLRPGETAALTTRLRQSQMIGDMKSEIFLVSNDPKTPRYPVTVIGEVVPRAQANAELVSTFIDLGVVQPGENIPFDVRIRSTGNQGLQLKGIQKTKNIYEVSSQLTVAPGEEGVLRFRFVAAQEGPIEETVTISTNDPLQETLPFKVKGYVANNWVPDRALVIYPVGNVVRFHPTLGTYQYDLVIENRGDVGVELRSVESTLPFREEPKTVVIPPRSKDARGVPFNISILEPKPLTGTVSLQLVLPVEIR